MRFNEVRGLVNECEGTDNEVILPSQDISGLDSPNSRDSGDRDECSMKIRVGKDKLARDNIGKSSVLEICDSNERDDPVVMECRCKQEGYQQETGSNGELRQRSMESASFSRLLENGKLNDGTD